MPKDMEDYQKIYEVRQCLSEQVRKIDDMLASAGVDLDDEAISSDEMKKPDSAGKKEYSDGVDHKALVLSVEKVMGE